ncbi:RbsD/FucU domain-containing protein [Roseimaritima ulvae]|uniref:Uncharacterized protein n=1 Tax=Roseimaritima ulvae TaxID=980254 RepID=A0A5B9QZ41_9BACT|nr:RbsD/FucU domain-containing protein [Roseimaritima ulvae]QEG43130.1 hypothetical protein UC8_51740 [Roseimaritima ulvae]
MKRIGILLLALVGCSSLAAETPGWQQTLKSQLPLLGHRNWIVIADSAYPAQTAAGIKTVYTGEKQLEVVREVLALVAEQSHVRGKVFTDAELTHVPEQYAKGISDYRAGLEKALQDQDVTSLPHGEIISMLDEAGQTFQVLVLKTDLTLPYTSVFIRLDCGYWSDAAEEQLRAAIERAPATDQ